MKQSIQKFVKDNVQPARTILLNSRNVEFLGILAYALKLLVFDPNNSEGEKKGKGENKGFLGYTDGKRITLGVYEKATPREVAFIICHELLHILMYSMERRHNRDPVIWNIATDHVINTTLKPYTESGTLHWIDGCVYFEDFERDNPGATAEEVYEYLMNEKVVHIEYAIYSMDENGNSQKVPDGTDPSDIKGKKYAKVTYKYPDGTKEEQTVPLDESSCKGKEAKDVQDRAKYIWSSDSSGLSKGDMPGEMKELLDQLLKVEVPWDMILERSILYHSQETVNRGWKIPDIYMRGKRLNGHGKMYTPGKVESEQPQIALFVIDSSGSISEKDLKTFVGIICDSVQHYQKLGVLVHDIKVTQEEWFLDRPSEDTVFDNLKEIAGRGGTSHKEVFEKIGELEEQYQISVVVFMTDFYSDVEYHYRDNSWFKNIPSIWVINNDINVEFDSDYDTTIIRIN